MEICMFRIYLNLVLISATIFACNHGVASESEMQKNIDLETVKFVDLNRYMGKWFEIASFPQRFQKGCTATTANYSLNEDGNVDVVNQCHLDSLNGNLKTAKGIAKIVDKSTNAKLKVSFFWPFYGAYWIIELGENYEYAVVGHPSREYLWILSRTPQISSTLFEDLKNRIAQKGFDLSRLQMTQQPQQID